MGRRRTANRIVKMPRRTSKRINLQFREIDFRDLGEEMVDDGGAFDAALAVEDEDYFFEGGGFEGVFEDEAAGANVGGGVFEVPLDEAFDEVEEDAFAGGERGISGEGGEGGRGMGGLTLGSGRQLFRA